jgi:hypothetical protein
MCIVYDSKDWTEESAKRLKASNPSPAVARLMRIKEQAEKRLMMHIEEQAEKRLKANIKLGDSKLKRLRESALNELNSKLKRLRESALNAPAIFKFDPARQAPPWGQDP